MGWLKKHRQRKEARKAKRVERRQIRKQNRADKKAARLQKRNERRLRRKERKALRRASRKQVRLERIAARERKAARRAQARAEGGGIFNKIADTAQSIFQRGSDSVNEIISPYMGESSFGGGSSDFGFDNSFVEDSFEDSAIARDIEEGEQFDLEDKSLLSGLSKMLDPIADPIANFIIKNTAS